MTFNDADQTRADFQRCLDAMDNGIDEGLWPSGMHIGDAIRRIIRQRDELLAENASLAAWQCEQCKARFSNAPTDPEQLKGVKRCHACYRADLANRKSMDLRRRMVEQVRSEVALRQKLVSGLCKKLLFTIEQAEWADLSEAQYRMALKAAADALRDRDHWKANHDEAIRRNAILRDRPDLPTERTESYAAIMRDRDELLERLAQAEARERDAAAKAELQRAELAKLNLANADMRAREARRDKIATAHGEPLNMDAIFREEERTLAALRRNVELADENQALRARLETAHQVVERLCMDPTLDKAEIDAARDRIAAGGGVPLERLREAPEDGS